MLVLDTNNKHSVHIGQILTEQIRKYYHNRFTRFRAFQTGTLAQVASQQSSRVAPAAADPASGPVPKKLQEEIQQGTPF